MPVSVVLDYLVKYPRLKRMVAKKAALEKKTVEQYVLDYICEVVSPKK